MLYRIIIAGSRDFTDYEKLCSACDAIITGLTANDAQSEIVIISGGARGADKLAEQYAREKKYKNNIIKAEWDRYGKKAGYLRNAVMADKATARNGQGYLIAFWDGKSHGTRHMIDIAEKKKMHVSIIGF